MINNYIHYNIDSFRNLVFILIIILPASCKNKTDVLATYLGGEITRGELYSRIKEKNLPLKAFRMKKNYQKKELKMLAVDKISIIEAKKNDFHQTHRFNFLFNDVKVKYMGAFLFDKIFEEEGFKEKAVNISHIVLKLKDDSKAEEERALTLASDILHRLNIGESFEKLAARYSEDISRTKSGKVGYVLYDMFPKLYADTAFSLKKGSVSENPVFLKKRLRIFIIKVHDIKELTPDTIEEIIPDNKMRESYSDLIKRTTQKKYIDKLKETYNAVYDEKTILSKNEDLVLFKIKNNNYTVADFNKRYNNIIRLSNRSNLYNSPGLKEKIAREFFTMELLKHAAAERKIDQNQEYLKKINSLRDSYLAGDFMEHINSSNIKISPDEMIKEYNINKDKKYFEIKNVNGKKVKIVKPFDSVKIDIENSIRSMKTMRSKAKWIDDILIKYNYQVKEKKLEGI